MLSLSAPSDELPAALSAGSELGKSAKNVLAAAKGQSWRVEDLEMANAWPLLPVLKHKVLLARNRTGQLC